MRNFVLFILVVFLAGCANNTEMVTNALKDRKPQQCSFTDRSGETQRFEGPICENIARAKMLNACSDLAENQQGACIMAIAFGNAQGSRRTSEDVQLLIAAMNNDTQIKAAYIGQIPLVGTAINAHYSYKADKAMFEVFESGFSMPSTMNITQSNDGGGVGGEAGGGGRGGDGDLLVFTGDSAQSLNRSDGSVVSDGRNGTFMGLNEPDSSFDPTTQNLNNAEGATNDNAPAVQTSDDDGGQSIIPGF